ncbi:nucleolar protein 8 [Chytridiales sp. JEL 0842]|nr:nucleolar protein 8 [Chytridiales sp. JEL 0842]
MAADNDAPADEKVIKRLYVGGINETVTENELRTRFQPFGKIIAADLKPGGPQGQFKGFSYVSIETTPTQLKRCLNVYNKTKWRGMQLKVEEAKPDYMSRLKKEWAEAEKTEKRNALKAENPKPKTIKIRKSKKWKPYVMAHDMSLVTDENMSGRKGWKRSRFGRAVAVFKARMWRKMKSRVITIDPLKYKNNLVKLALQSINEKPVTQLSWPGLDASSPSLQSVVDSNANNTNTERIDISLQASPETFINPERAKPTTNPPQKVIPPKPKLPYQWSDDDESDGEPAQGRGETKNEEDESAPPVILNDKELEEERVKSMSILRSLLNMPERSEQDTKRHFGVQWTAPKRFDPKDLTQSTLLLRKGDDDIVEEPSGSSEATPMEDIQTASPPDSTVTDTSTSTSDTVPQPPATDPTKTYTVSTNLRSLVFGSSTESSSTGLSSLFSKTATNGDEEEQLGTGTGPGMQADEIRKLAGAVGGGVIGKTQSFSLLGALGIQPVEEEVEEADKMETAEIAANEVPLFSSSSLFFFHFGNPHLAKRDEITKEWEDRRKDLTFDYKRKHKSASRKKSKMKAGSLAAKAKKV